MKAEQQKISHIFIKKQVPLCKRAHTALRKSTNHNAKHGKTQREKPSNR